MSINKSINQSEVSVFNDDFILAFEVMRQTSLSSS